MSSNLRNVLVQKTLIIIRAENVFLIYCRFVMTLMNAKDPVMEAVLQTQTVRTPW